MCGFQKWPLQSAHGNSSACMHKSPYQFLADFESTCVPPADNLYGADPDCEQGCGQDLGSTRREQQVSHLLKNAQNML